MHCQGHTKFARWDEFEDYMYPAGGGILSVVQPRQRDIDKAVSERETINQLEKARFLRQNEAKQLAQSRFRDRFVNGERNKKRERILEIYNCRGRAIIFLRSLDQTKKASPTFRGVRPPQRASRLRRYPATLPRPQSAALGCSEVNNHQGRPED